MLCLKSDFTVEQNAGIFKSRICTGLVLWQRHSRERHPLTRCYTAEGPSPPQPHPKFPRSAEALSFGRSQRDITTQLREKAELVSCRRHCFKDRTRIQTAVWICLPSESWREIPKAPGFQVLKSPKLNTRSSERHSQS